MRLFDSVFVPYGGNIERVYDILGRWLCPLDPEPMKNIAADYGVTVPAIGEAKEKILKRLRRPRSAEFARLLAEHAGPRAHLQIFGEPHIKDCICTERGRQWRWHYMNDTPHQAQGSVWGYHGLPFVWSPGRGGIAI